MKSEIAHCDINKITKELAKSGISADFKMGAGIAVEFDKRYHIKDRVNQYWPDRPKIVLWPTCFLVDHVFNIITKERYYHKPTYKDMFDGIQHLKVLTDLYRVKCLVIPHIGCGLDRLKWSEVRKMLQSVYQKTNIKIYACAKPDYD